MVDIQFNAFQKQFCFDFLAYDCLWMAFQEAHKTDMRYPSNKAYKDTYRIGGQAHKCPCLFYIADIFVCVQANYQLLCYFPYLSKHRSVPYKSLHNKYNNRNKCIKFRCMFKIFICDYVSFVISNKKQKNYFSVTNKTLTAPPNLGILS